MTARRVAVLDIGKTNAKVALVDLDSLSEVAVRSRPNTVRPGPPYPHFDAEGLWDFALDALADLHREAGVDAVSVAAHGASAVLLDRDGGLAAPILDYEHDGPETMRAAYDALRPPFDLTGSPRLPGGLNVGAQLHWQLATLPGLRDRLAQVVTYPQYWSGRLTGRWASEATSLGCHTDLWEPRAGRFSPLVAALGLSGRMAPLVRADAPPAPILPEIAASTGLPPGTPVATGLHDSNASLYPHLLRRTPPFAIVSTGTWVICMAVGGAGGARDPARDTLVNVAATGQAVPSARFMGGRDHAVSGGDGRVAPGAAEIDDVLDTGAMLLPAVTPGTGPYPQARGGWTCDADSLSPGVREAALAFYLAMMTATCLDLVGADGPVVVEGPFATNRPYLRMLATATGRPVEPAGASATGTAIGAALLIGGRPGDGGGAPVLPQTDPRWRTYAAAWRDRVGR